MKLNEFRLLTAAIEQNTMAATQASTVQRGTGTMAAIGNDIGQDSNAS